MQASPLFPSLLQTSLAFIIPWTQAAAKSKFLSPWLHSLLLFRDFWQIIVDAAENLLYNVAVWY
jgi:hypothetical protein